MPQVSKLLVASVMGIIYTNTRRLILQQLKLFRWQQKVTVAGRHTLCDWPRSYSNPQDGYAAFKCSGEEESSRTQCFSLSAIGGKFSFTVEGTGCMVKSTVASDE